jgi:hypothetical protein
MKKENTLDSTDSTKLAIWFDDNGNQTIVTIKDYKEYIKNNDKESIAEFLYHRLHSRYLKPFLYDDCKFDKLYKNGFSIMANCSLLIETLQSFKNGWGDSNRRSEKAFEQFFESETNFEIFKGPDFYKHVRCGILHQGEVRGGWKISRDDKDGSLFDEETLTVNANRFAKELEKSLQTYSNKLRDEKWDSCIWKKFRKKMKQIITNCEKDELKNEKCDSAIWKKFRKKMKQIIANCEKKQF